MICITIPGRLPGLNEYIRACRGSRYGGAQMAKDVERRIKDAIKPQLRGIRFDQPVGMHYAWFEPDRRRDKDNVAFAKKFIQDSLVQLGVLRGDGWREIEYFTDTFDVDAEHPRVEIEITEVDRMAKNKRPGKRVKNAAEKLGNTYADALTTKTESDYARAKLDGAISRMMRGSGDFKPFEQRYEYIKEVKYD